MSDQTIITWRQPTERPDDGDLVIVDTGEHVATGEAQHAMISGENFTVYVHHPGSTVTPWRSVDRWASTSDDIEETADDR